MPLVRVEVRNEYGLGAPELYKDSDKEDPKLLLEGLAVAGLVGILRQLGDLAEFAAEVFHGIQEQVTITSSRSHKLMGRVKQIEAALPPLEKLVLAQSSHLHFAYTPGLNWRANLHNEQSHFIYSDLPRFMMNSYEQCRGPPNLNKLDKFDPGGPGSCLKRYSDPSFFRKTLKGSGLGQKKSRKIKKKRSWLHNGEISRGVSNFSGSMHFPSLSLGEQTSPCPTVSTYELKDLDFGYQSLSFDSRNGSLDFEHVSQPRFPLPYKNRDSTGSCSSQSRMPRNDSQNFASTGSKDAVLYCDSPSSISGEGLFSKSNQVSWDEKMEMLVAETREHSHDEMLETSSVNLGFENNEGRTSHLHDESVEVSNLYLDNDEKVSSHFQTFEINLQKVSLETLSTDINVENQRGSAVSEGAAQMDIVPENENRSMGISDDVHYDDLHCGTVVEMNTHPDDKNILLSNSGDFHRDEIESETDHFVDALNAIESEYESDAECQTKQEMEQHSRVDSKDCSHGEDKDRLVTPPGSAIISSSPEIVAHANGSPNVDASGIHLDLDLPVFCSEVNTSAANLSTDQANLVPFECHASLQPQLPDNAFNSISSTNVDDLLKNDIVGSSNVESAVCHVSFLGRDVLVPGNDKNTCGSPVLPKPPPEPSSTMLWTNGGLLGLQPSKPPDFSSENTGSQIPKKCKDETITSYIPKSDVKEKSDTCLKEDVFSECSTSYLDGKSGNLTRKAQRKSLSTDLGVNLLKLSDSYHQTHTGNIQNDAYTPPGDVRPVRPDIKSSQDSQEKSNSSRMLELGNKLLLNGFYRKPALLKDENPYLDGSVNDDGLKQCNGQNIGCQTFSARGRDMLGSESPLISPASSPPLGHMKISFQPINGSKAPNLQLKLPDGNFNHEGGRDLFTSFQLVPDPNIEFHDFGSDSDDDTFCHSSPCGSDNIIHQSDSNSEQWESHESPDNKEDLYDALRRISLTEYVPNSWGTSETIRGDVNNNYTQLSQFPRDTADSSYSCHLYDELPNLECFHPSFKDVSSNCVPEQHYQKEFTSSPLPLHESQWQVMKPQSKFPESRQINMPEYPGHVFDRKLESTATQKPKSAPQSQEEINGDKYLLKSKSQDLRKLTPVKNFSQASNGNVEPKGDFLQQIRAKSLNLRRTGIPKPTVAADTTNVQVNAILEKANAIRKAVGSDRDDDNWSDT